MLQSQGLAIPDPCLRDVLYLARDLAQRTHRQCLTHGHLRGKKSSAARHAVPAPQRGAVLEFKLLQYIGDMEFDGVQADATALRDHAIAEAMTHRFHHPPFGRGQKVVMRRTATLGHDPSLTRQAGNYPPLPICPPLPWAC